MQEHSLSTKCGTIAIVGRPNVGKSSLLNALVGQKLAIVSPKPQATRCPVVGIVTEGNSQLIFVDHPGLLQPAYLLQHAMRQSSLESVQCADAILHLRTVGDGEERLDVIEPLLAGLTRPTASVVTKADQIASAPPLDCSDPLTPRFVVSAKSGTGVSQVLEWCRAQVPVAPFRYDPEDVSTQPMRFFVTECVREAAYDLLQDELPYSLAAEVDEFREGSDPLYIRVTVYVERASQKPLVIGAAGRTIRTLGVTARKKIESLVGQQVYLDLWVKVLPRWRSNGEALARFGLPLPREAQHQ